MEVGVGARTRAGVGVGVGARTRAGTGTGWRGGGARGAADKNELPYPLVERKKQECHLPQQASGITKKEDEALATSRSSTRVSHG